LEPPLFGSHPRAYWRRDAVFYGDLLAQKVISAFPGGKVSTYLPSLCRTVKADKEKENNASFIGCACIVPGPHRLRTCTYSQQEFEPNHRRFTQRAAFIRGL